MSFFKKEEIAPPLRTIDWECPYSDVARDGKQIAPNDDPGTPNCRPGFPCQRMKNTLLEAVFADMLALQKSIPSDYSYIRGASVQYAIDDKAINADCICEGPIGCVGFGEGTREDEHKYATTHPGDNRNPYIEQYVLWEQGLVPDFDAAYEKARLRAVAAKKKH